MWVKGTNPVPRHLTLERLVCVWGHSYSILATSGHVLPTPRSFKHKGHEATWAPALFVLLDFYLFIGCATEEDVCLTAGEGRVGETKQITGLLS